MLAQPFKGGKSAIHRHVRHNITFTSQLSKIVIRHTCMAMRQLEKITKNSSYYLFWHSHCL